jgi:hypothetical protein
VSRAIARDHISRHAPQNFVKRGHIGDILKCKTLASHTDAYPAFAKATVWQAIAGDTLPLHLLRCRYARRLFAGEDGVEVGQDFLRAEILRAGITARDQFPR